MQKIEPFHKDYGSSIGVLFRVLRSFYGRNNCPTESELETTVSINAQPPSTSNDRSQFETCACILCTQLLFETEIGPVLSHTRLKIYTYVRAR